MCNVTCTGCNRTSGVCDTGCKPGWRDLYCHKGICLINVKVQIILKHNTCSLNWIISVISFTTMKTKVIK